MDNNQVPIVDFVGALLQKGLRRDQIKEQLLAVGWSESDADQAYSQALIRSGVPVPSDAMQSTFAKKSSAMEVILNLFSFILLGIVASALATLFYQIINKYFPETLVLNYRSNRVSTDSIHYATAALIIAYPIYYWSMHFWFERFEQDEGKIETKLSKWLTYLVLLVSSVTIVGDLIYSLFMFLEGELSVRFVLKALTIFFIAGSIFGFYFLERKKIQYRKLLSRNIFKYFGVAVSLVIIMGIVLGFFAVGSPATERMRGFDNQRESDLSAIEACIRSYAKEFKRLPNSLADMQYSSYSYCSAKKDPETKIPYEYNLITASKNVGTNREAEYELCANFSLASEDNVVDKKYYYNESRQWNDHRSGRHCGRVQVVIEDFN